jgi:hypothetical protein
VVHPSTYGKLHGTIANSLTPERASHSTSNRSVLLRNRCLQIPKIHEASPASSRPTETSCAVTYAVLDMHLWSSSFPFYSDCSMCLQKDAPFSRTACFLLFLIVRSSAWPPTTIICGGEPSRARTLFGSIFDVEQKDQI